MFSSYSPWPGVGFFNQCQLQASSLHLTAKFMEHADGKNGAPWEGSGELAEGFCRSEHSSRAIACPFICLHFKRLHGLICFAPLTKSSPGSTRHIIEYTRVFSTTSSLFGEDHGLSKLGISRVVKIGSSVIGRFPDLCQTQVARS